MVMTKTHNTFYAFGVIVEKVYQEFFNQVKRRGISSEPVNIEVECYFDNLDVDLLIDLLIEKYCELALCTEYDEEEKTFSIDLTLQADNAELIPQIVA